MENIIAAWKLTHRNPLIATEENTRTVYVVRYADGTGNILGECGPLLADGVSFDHEPDDFLSTAGPFWSIHPVDASQVPA